MSHPKLLSEAQASATPPEPRTPVVSLDPNGIYLPEQVRSWLKLRKSTLAAEIKAGRLRVSKRVGRYFFLGVWLRDWIASGELKRKESTA